MQGIRLLNKGVIIKKSERKSDAGIILTDDAKEIPVTGEIVDVNGIDSVKVGDTVIYMQYGPHEVKFGEELFLIAREEDLLAIVEK